MSLWGILLPFLPSPLLLKIEPNIKNLKYYLPFPPLLFKTQEPNGPKNKENWFTTRDTFEGISEFVLYSFH